MKKILSRLVLLMAMAGILTVSAMANGESDATIAFRQGIAAGGEVTLSGDITDLTRDIIVTPSTNSVTIDGNGYTIDLEGTYAFYINHGDTEITFKNIKINGAHQMGAIQNKASTNVDITLNAVEITYGTLASGISGSAVYNKNGDIYATNCTFTSMEGAINNYPIYSNDNSGAKDIKDCTFSFGQASETNMEIVCNDGGWRVYPQSEATVKAWAEYTGWGTGTVAHINTDIILTNQITIACGKSLHIDDGSTLTVEKGATLTATGATVTVDNGGTLMNNAGTLTDVVAPVSTPVAQIGDKIYPSLAAAVADGGDITLLADTDIREAGIVVAKDVTLDLNDKKITVMNAGGKHIKVASGATLTLKDSGEAGEITIIDGGNNYGGVHVEGQFVMESGYINGNGRPESQETINAVSVSNGGEATIQGGKIEADQASLCNLNGNGGYSLITVTGGQVGSIYSTYTAKPAGHDVVVTGGTVGAITIKSSKYAQGYGIVPKMLITGGAIQSVNFVMYDADVPVSETYFVYGITGGTFEVLPTAGIPEGYEPKENADGTYGVGAVYVPPVPSKPATYKSTVSDTTNGTVTLSATKAKANTEITITATPVEGYKVGTITVTYPSGREVTVTPNEDGTYAYKQPGANVTVNVVFYAISTGSRFYDVTAGTSYFDAVEWAAANAVTMGITDTMFMPEMTCTRAHAVTFLYRAAGSPAVTGTNPFTDVAPESYYYGAVLWAVQEGITKGMTDTTFAPDATCTRGQIVTFLHRAAGETTATGDLDFTDVDLDSYYGDAVLWAVDQEITNGMTDTTFAPDADCTRGQIVTFLHRAS